MNFDLEKGIYPEDIKKMSDDELRTLAIELRKFIIMNVSKTGGHLASNLGIVELTIALHKIFETPDDKIVWDVGHQSYVHKILTGRGAEFASLRKLNGISGFPKRSESVYDTFDSGHSSNSISAALGMAVTMELQGNDNSVVAVIGDGALTGGIAYEALNNAGCLHTKLIVILNDNEMSISKNGGSVAQHLGSLRSSKRYNEFKAKLGRGLRKIPKIGEDIFGSLITLRDSVKYAFLPEGVIFEELGFKYIGPINGHDLSDLTEVLTDAKSIDGPVIIHIVTEKGKGYPPAVAEPERFHSTGAFNPKTGEAVSNSNEMTYSEVFGSKMISVAENNDDLVCISAAMIGGVGLDDFASIYPERIFDVGIAEQHAVTFAAGISIQGMRPVVAIYSTFLQRAYDQILIDICEQDLPVIFAIDRAGLVGADGETHNGIFDLSYLLHMPNLTVMAPSTTKELERMIDHAITLKGPVAIRYPKGSPCIEISDVHELPELPGSLLYREGKDVTILAAGKMLSNAVQALEHLTAFGIDAEIVDPRILKPLDAAAIVESAKKTKLVFTIEDNVCAGGFGSAVEQCLEENDCSSIPVFKIGWPGRFIQHGCVSELESLYGLDPVSIAERVRVEVERKA